MEAAQPHSSARQAQAVDLPALINGRLEKPGELDFYAVDARTGQELSFEVVEAEGFDPHLVLYRPGGSWFDPDRPSRILFDQERTSDLMPLKAQGTFRVPQSGRYFVEVSSIFGRGSSDCTYLLRISLAGDPRPGYVQSHAHSRSGRNDVSFENCKLIGPPCWNPDRLTRFASPVMTTSLRNNFADVPDLFKDLANGNLPAVSFVRPYEIYAGHPANSGLSFYEDFTAQLSNAVINNEDLFRTSAIFLTKDEGGGYYDSGYIQPIDFFGDGTRIPLIAISPYAKEGYVDHTYYDHGSILKFIEANWKLKLLSSRSRDNLPNPVPSASPYIPSNAPAIVDLMNLFDFEHFRRQTPLIIP